MGHFLFLTFTFIFGFRRAERRCIHAAKETSFSLARCKIENVRELTSRARYLRACPQVPKRTDAWGPALRAPPHVHVKARF
jgi:hypothetical protein